MLNGNNLRRIKMNKKFKCILSILASAAIISTFSYNSIYSAEKGNTLLLVLKMFHLLPTLHTLLLIKK